MAVACGRGSEDGASGSSSDLATGVTLAPATTLAVTKSGPAFSTQTQAVIVAGANQYLAAWTELHLATKKSTVVAARIGADGSLLDERSITFPSSPPSAPGDDGSIALAFDGTSYLAVWSHESGSTSVLKGLRIGADGKLLDAQPFTLGRANGMAVSPAVAYTTGGYLVTWSDDRDSGASADSYVNEVYGARISTAGAVVGSPEGFRITNAPGTLDGSLSVAAVGSTFLVGYAKRTGNTTVPQAVRVSDAGAVLDATPLSFGAGGDLGAAPAIAADGSQFFVAWNDVATQKLSGTRVTKDGQKVDDSAIEISANHPVPPAVTWDGDAFSVAWKYGTQRVGANGALVGNAMTGGPASVSGERPAIASVGSSLFVVHYVDADDERRLPLRLSANLLPKAGGAPIQSDVFLARGLALQRSVASAAHGGTSLSVWLEYEDPSHPKVNGALFANGTATPIAIDPGGSNAAPTVAWDGTTYAVAWQSDATSKIVHVNDSGSVIDTAVAYPGRLPELTAGSPNKVLLTTHDASNATQGWFVGNPGAKILTRAAEPAGWIAGPTAKPAWDGNRYVLAWAATKSDGNVEIHAQRFDKSGREMDVPPVKIATLPLPSGAALPTVTLATNGADTLIAFDAPTSHQILGARLTPTGVADAAPVRLDAGATGFAFEPRLAWDGTQWTLAYERRPDAIAIDPAGYPLELTRIRATSAGLAVNGAAEAIANRALMPAVAPGAKGATFLGYESIGTDDLAGPRISLTLFTDTSGFAAPGSSSSGGTTAGGGDDDDSSGPVAPGDGSGDPKKPSGPKLAPTKGATIKPVGNTGAAGGGDGDGGGCSSTGGGHSSSTAPLFLALAMLVSRRFARRTRVPDARR
jgi:hypothetical protein